MADGVTDLVTREHLAAIVQALATLVVGLAVAWAAAWVVSRVVARRVGVEHAQTIRRVVWLLLSVLVGVSALSALGVDLGVLLGAAGLLTVAIGFASQTSASNLISGLFLLAERPFIVGDTIRLGATVGEVIAVDLLSVKLRTFDNLLVRIPNELLLKSEFANLTHFPIRRIDLALSVGYEADLARARDVVLAAATSSLRILAEPVPNILFTGFADSGVTFRLAAWTRRENFFEVTSELYIAVKKALDEAGISVPYPHRTLDPSKLVGGIPVALIGEQDTGGETL